MRERERKRERERERKRERDYVYIYIYIYKYIQLCCKINIIKERVGEQKWDSERESTT